MSRAEPSANERPVSERLRSLLNVIPYPGTVVVIDHDAFQLLTDLHAHFAACEAMLKREEFNLES